MAGLEKTRFGIVRERGTQGLKTDKMRIHSAAADFISTWLGHAPTPKRESSGPQDHRGASQGASFWRNSSVLNILN